MNKVMILTIMAIVLVACNSQHAKKPSQPKVKFRDDLRPVFVKKTQQPDLRDSLKTVSNAPETTGVRLLKGFWSVVGEDNATLAISDTDIFYPDENVSVKYTIRRDSIKIFYDGAPESFKYKFSGADTLLLCDSTDTSKFYRFKN